MYYYYYFYYYLRNLYEELTHFLCGKKNTLECIKRDLLADYTLTSVENLQVEMVENNTF